MSTNVGMSSCCLSGTIANGTPKGREETINGLPTYVAEPEGGSTGKTVIFIVDIFGWKLPNVRLLADHYALAGITTYIPDVHEGDSIDEGFLNTIEPQLPKREALTLTEKATSTASVGATLGPWLLRHREAVARPLIENFIDKARYIPGTDRVGAIGFCWGGRYALLAGAKGFSAADGKGVDAVYACHPSLVSIPADFEDICVPTALAVGGKDSLLGEAEVAQIQEVMEKKRQGVEWTPLKESEVRVYEDQVHGFALRGDWSSEKDKKAMDEAEKQGIEWFKKYL
nr:protein aim2 [Quercus suber]